MKKHVLIAALVLSALSLNAQTFVNVTPTAFVQSVGDGSSAAYGDLNGDGKLDIILIGDKGNNVYLNDGKGGFTLADKTTTGLDQQGMWWSSVDIADYDGDGKLDVVMQGWDGSQQHAFVYKGNGNGTFTKVTTLNGLSNGNIQFGDYDNDGKLDIIQTGWRDAATLAPAGGFTNIYHNAGNNVFTLISTPQIMGVADGQAKWGDLNKDGKLDIVLEGWNATKIFLGNGAGGFTEKSNTLPAYDLSFVNIVDYDKDGNLDILFGGHVPGGSTWETKVAKGDGAGNFTLQNFGLPGVERGPAVIGDCNKDGYNDIFIAGWNGGGSFYIYKNDGTNNSFSSVTGINSVIAGYPSGSLLVKDFNGDGYDEIFKCGWGLTKLYTNSSTTGFYRSKNSGNWSDTNIWETSADNLNWIPATSFPTSYSNTVSILNNNLVTIADNTSATTLNVNPGAKLTLNSGKTISAGILNLNSDATGTATYVDNGGTTSVTINNVQQYLSSARNWYISSPVSGAKAKSGYIFYKRDEANNAWSSMTTGDGTTTGDALNLGQGYIANLASGSATYTFTGTLNTGNTNITVYRTVAQATKPGFNLVGNPYPSYLNARTVVNSSANLEKSIWYRTQIKSSTTYTFDTYNSSGDVGTNNSNNNSFVIGTVPPMQAFWVRVVQGQTSATLNFSNLYRSHANDTINLYKSKALNTIDQPILRLQVSNGINNDEAVVYFNPNASNEYDSFDSPKMTNSSASIPEIYLIAGAEQLSIDGLNSVQYDTELALGFTTTTTQNGSFSLKASQFSSFDAGTQVYLKDYQSVNPSQLINMSNGNSYSFNSDAVNTSGRFALIFKAPLVATGINPNTNTNVWISLNGKKQIVINDANGPIQVAVYNEVGQKLESQTLKATTNTIESQFAPGVYLVTVSNAGKIITKKVIID